MTRKTYHGSCHCKAVRFEADIDFAEGTTKCNCTWCWKHRWWSVSVTPEQFRPLAGAAALSDHKPRSDNPDGGFCRHCGTMVYGYHPQSDWNPAPKVGISIAVLDDLDPAELLAAPVTHCDGLADNWWHPPAEIRHL